MDVAPPAKFLAPSAQECTDGYRAVRRSVLRKLYGKAYPPTAVGLEDVSKELDRLLSDTLTLGQGDSCILVGPRGAGITMVIEKSLEKLRNQHLGEFLTVKLSGLTHPDDRMAMREIARQLDCQIPGANSIEKLSISATMNAITQLFDQAAVADANVDDDALDTMIDDNVPSNKTPTKTVSVIFVVEDLDRYTTSSRQSLLYMLFGLSQNSPIGVSVIGSTTRHNIDELLEKRVRSRFSQRTLTVTRPHTLRQFKDIARVLLEVNDSSVVDLYPEQSEAWNQKISADLADDSPDELNKIVTETYFTSKSPKVLASKLACLLVGVPSRDLQELNCISSTETLLQGMAELDWAILLCAARSQARYEATTNEGSVNLIMVMDEYRLMTKELQHERSAGMNFGGYRAWSTRAVRHAWERLRAISMIVPATNTTSVGQEDLKMVQLETSLQDLRGFLPKDHPLYSWTQL